MTVAKPAKATKAQIAKGIALGLIPASEATKPAAKAAPKKPAKAAKAPAKQAKGKTVRKAPAKKADDKKPSKQIAEATVKFIERRAIKGKPLFVLDEISRPVSGTRLVAHTHAALSVMGLLDASRPSVPKKAVLAIMGQRAVAYHVSAGNFEQAKDGLRLSILGANKFKDRKVDGAMANAFTDMLIDGKADKVIQVQESNLYPVALGI